MEVTFLYKNLSKAEEGKFNDYLPSKIEAVASLLTKFADDAKILKIAIEKFDKHDAYQVEWNLTLPSKSLKATEASHQMTKATDLSKDRLLSQIKKHIAQLSSRDHGTIRDVSTHQVQVPIEMQ